MGVNLTLNDFKRLLGNVNDGDVVYKRNADDTAVGIEKANHGNWFTRKVYGYRTATGNPVENAEIRDKLFEAIKLSPEGRAMTEQNIARFRTMLGLDDQNAKARVLGRSTLKAVLDTVEALSRGQDVETQTPSVSIKGILQMADNRILRQQVDCLQQRGFSSLDSLKMIQNVRKCTQDVSTIMDEKYLGLLFAKGHLGHTKEEMLRFVRNSAASIQSQVFDKLFWRLQDAIAAAQPGKKKVMINFCYKDVLLEVINDMMTDYGKGKEPVAKALGLLRPSPAPSLDEDPQLMSAGKDFLAGIDRKLDLFFCHPTASGFEAAQLKHYVSQLRNHLYATYADTYRKNNGGVAGRNAAEEAVGRELGALAGYSDGLLDKLGKNEKIVRKVGSFVLSAIAACTADGGRLSEADLVKVLSGTVREFNARQNLQPVVEQYLKNSNVDDIRKEPLRELLTNALEATDGNFGDFLDDVRLRMVEASIDGLDPKAVALGIIDTEPFVTEVERIADGLFDPAAIEAQRLRLITEAANIRTEGRDTPLIVDEILTSTKYLTADAPEFLDRLKGDAVFCGKLTIASEMGLLDGCSKEELGGVLMIDRGARTWGITNENLGRVVELINAAVAKLSLADLKLAVAYLKAGYSYKDSLVQATHPDKWPFLDMLRNNMLEFPQANPQVKNYLTEGLTAFLTDLGNVGGYWKNPSDLTSASISQEAFDLLYAELRAAAVPMGLVPAVESLAGVTAPPLPDDRTAKILPKRGDEALNLAKSNLGFATGDPMKMRSLLLRIGLRPEDLNDPGNWMKAHRLALVVAANNGHAEGAVEHAERIVGMPFGEMKIGDIAKQLLSKLVAGTKIDDPLSKLTGDAKRVADFIGGKLVLAEAKLSPEDLTRFLLALRKLEAGEETAVVELSGQPVSFRRFPNGELTATLGTGRKAMSVYVARTSGELLGQVENLIADKARDFKADQILAILPPVPTGTALLARPREIYSKILSGLLGLPVVNFAHLPVAELCGKVKRALDPGNRQALVAELSAAPKTFLGAEAVELQAKFLAADGVSRGLVKLPPSPPSPPFDPKKGDVLSGQATQDLVAELVMNKDTWAFDEGSRSPNRGDRLYKLFLAHGAEIKYLGDNPKVLDTLPRFELVDAIGDKVRSGVRSVIVGLAGLSEKDENEAKALCATLEADLDAVVEEAMAVMQQKASALFKAKDVDRPEVWKRSLAESTGADGLSTATMQGRFTQAVLQNYFVRCDPIEKRAMLANIFRNADSTSSEGKLVGEMLKGAGPLLQKTLQGLPLETFGKETQTALKDMKSNLLPISDIAIQAQLLELVRSSRGQILSVEVKKSIGQATVGQALLCHVRTKDRPVTGEDVVVKVLRPNAQTAVRREYEVFLAVAKRIDAESVPPSTVQQDALKARYASVLKEFDFTLEASNIDLCKDVYDQPTAHLDGDKTQSREKVHSMDRSHAVPGMMGAIVLQKVEGMPVDRLFEKAREEVAGIVKDIRKVTRAGQDGPDVTTYQANSVGQAITVKVDLWNKREVLLKQHKALTSLVDVWLENALFGEGVFHSDLHPGNVMINGFEVSVIDFGNVGRLQKQEQAQLVYMFADAMTGNANDFLDRVKALLADPGKQMLDGCRVALEKELKVILSKGTSKDVLPRLLAALSSLKDSGIPIPDSFHNFAEGMTRLQGVIDGLASEIEELEGVSDEIVFANECLDELIPPGVDNKMLKDFVGVLGRLGTDGAKFDPDELADQVSSFRNGYGLHNIPFVFKTDKEEDKAAIAKLFTGLESLFRGDDGGVTVLKALVATLERLPSVGISKKGVISNLQVATVSFGMTTLSGLVESYDALCGKGGSGEEKAELQKRIAFEIAKGFEGVLRAINPHSSEKCAIICRPADASSFFDAVGNTLEKRFTSIAIKMGVALGIEETKVSNVMKELEKKKNVSASLLRTMGTDTFSFNKLRKIKDELERLGELAGQLDSRVKSAREEALVSHDARLPRDEMRKIEACAREFRLPPDWKPDKVVATNRRSVEEILDVNFEALRKSLGVRELTDSQLAYFARVARAVTYETGFAKFVCDLVKPNAPVGNDPRSRFISSFAKAMEPGEVVEEESEEESGAESEEEV